MRLLISLFKNRISCILQRLSEFPTIHPEDEAFLFIEDSPELKEAITKELFEKGLFEEEIFYYLRTISDRSK